MLIEVLVGLLIFLVGALGLMGYIGRSMSNSVDAKFRAQAAMLAQQYYARLEASMSTLDRGSNLATYSAALGAQSQQLCTAWQADTLTAPSSGISGATASCSVSADGSAVVLTIQWTVRAAGAGQSATVAKFTTEKPII